MFTRSIAILSLLLISTVSLLAQGGSGGLSGTVTDPNGGGGKRRRCESHEPRPILAGTRPPTMTASTISRYCLRGAIT